MGNVSKRATPRSKIGIGVTGNVLAGMKARQERRISGILKQNSDESQECPDKTDKIETPKSNLSPNPIGGVRLRASQLTPDDPDPEKGIGRFNRAGGAEEAESERSKSTNPIASVRLRPRVTADECDASGKASEEKCNNALNNFRLRTTSTVVTEDADVSEKSESKPSNPLSGVRLRSTGINVAKSPSNSNNGEAENKNDARNSLTKLKPPPLAPKPRPWSIVGSDKKSEVARRNNKTYLTDSEDQDGVRIESAEDEAVKGRDNEKDLLLPFPQQPSPPSVLFLKNFILEDAVDV